MAALPFSEADSLPATGICRCTIPKVPLPEASAASGSRKTLAGFLVSGLLLSFTGAVLPVWGYHLRTHFVAIGNYFLSLNAGLIAAVPLARWILHRRSAGFLLSLACAIGVAGIIVLALSVPPVSEWWRLPGFILIGMGAGLLNTGLFHALTTAYRENAVRTVTVAGAYFGLGSVVAVLLVLFTFNVYTPGSLLLLLAIFPGLFAVWFARRRFNAAPPMPERTRRDVIRESTAPSAVLLSALLFFHFGNEWTIAVWLPLFLIQRLGISPAAAMLLLALYWLALVAGRLITQAALPYLSHRRLLAGSVIASIFGCIVLEFTNNIFGAFIGTLLVGIGFAPVYPLVVETIGARFPYYHPGVFNGIFSLALTGGMIVPATLGYAAEYFGLGAVMVWPVVGTAMVFLLVLLIWLEAKLTGGAVSSG